MLLSMPKCRKCGTELERWSTARYDCPNPDCREKYYTGW